MISKGHLRQLYLRENKSMLEIARVLDCSVNKVQYWIKKHKVPSRSISEAVYIKNNPNGDPFKFTPPKSQYLNKLFGLGLGLYWGEGTKANKASVRLGNSDPQLVKVFIVFLEKIFSVRKMDMRFGLQIFSDMPRQSALDFWVKKLRIKRSQFYKIIVTPYRSIGTYRQKSKYGVLTVYYHNKRLRDELMELLVRETRVLLRNK